MRRAGLRELNFRFEFEGSKVVFDMVSRDARLAYSGRKRGMPVRRLRGRSLVLWILLARRAAKRRMEEPRAVFLDRDGVIGRRVRFAWVDAIRTAI